MNKTPAGPGSPANWELLRPTLRAVVVLGGFGWQAVLPVLAAIGWSLPRPRTRFGHGVHVQLPGRHSCRELHLLGCYHPSQRNIATHTLTTAMLRDMLYHVAHLARQ